VEEKVLELQQRKLELFNDLMAENETDYFSGKLTMEDFKNILS
jgi:SNF2 family DNA or RNA helicase